MCNDEKYTKMTTKSSRVFFMPPGYMGQVECTFVFKTQNKCLKAVSYKTECQGRHKHKRAFLISAAVWCFNRRFNLQAGV
jgi:hypothetical protein